MKIICLILAVYVIVLSTRPCCSGDDCKGKIAVKKERADKSPVKEKECPDCSPFFTCSSCVGFIITKPFTINLPVIPENRTAVYAAYQRPHIEKVVLSIWQPPQLS